MPLWQRRPAPPLDLFIESLWFSHETPGPRRHERVLPTGGGQLVVNLAEDETRVYRETEAGLTCLTSPGSILSGLTSRAQIIDSDEQSYVAGVAFRPGGTVAFTPHPAHELADVDVPLDVVWGNGATRRLRTRLLESPTPTDALDVLERTLRDTWRGRGCHPAVAFALERFRCRPTAARVAEVTAAVGLSEKRFIERFKAEVGVTPKRYCRLARFQHVVTSAHPMSETNWAELAASCGYTDQAHLIHEFREFSGLTPRAFERHKTAHPNHVSFLQS